MSHFIDECEFESLEQSIINCIDNLNDVHDIIDIPEINLEDSANDLYFPKKTIIEIKNELYNKYNANINAKNIWFKNIDKVGINRIKSKLENNLMLLKKIKRSLC